MLHWWKSNHAVWLKEILRPLLPRFSEVMTISFFSNLLALVVPIFTLQVYDRVVQHNGVSTLWVLVIGAAIALGFDFTLRQTRSRLLQHAALHIDAHLGRQLYDKLTTLPLKTLEERPGHYWQSLFADATLIRSVFSGPSALLIADIPFVFIFILVIMIIAWPVAWVVLAALLLFGVLTYFSLHTQDVATAHERQKTQHRDHMTAEMIQGRATVKALMIDQVMKPKWEDQHAHAIIQAYDRGVKTDNFLAAGQMLALLVTVAMVSVGALAIIERDMSIGSLIAANMLAGRIVGPLNQLLGNWKSFASCRQAIHRLDRLFHLPGERPAPGIERGRPAGRITAENLRFVYEQDRPVLQDVSFQINAGEVVGLVGRNGCGKSTLIKCIQGLYPLEKGRILLDDGDIQQFTRKQLAEWVGYVPQECFLFEGSIRDNIAKAWTSATDDAVMQAAKLADADRFISALPDGYATEIGEGGHRLSGGQRQRLAIARALLKNPPVLLFDEITSNLDNETELQLAQTLRRLSGERTVILATHSLILLSQCDRIIVLDQGRVALAGPAKAVLQRLTGTAPAQPQPAPVNTPPAPIQSAASPTMGNPSPPPQNYPGQTMGAPPFGKQPGARP